MINSTTGTANGKAADPQSTVGYLMRRVIEGPGTVSDIRRLANSNADGQIAAYPTAHGRVVLRALKRTAKKHDLPHLLRLLHRYGRYEASFRARSRWVRERAC
ncbi:hypothetical protein GCM10022233_88070 [Streptomyces shaanxiensis]|uniref:Tn3 transposase DDE domain-containing protein n=1 Tax=Streptomyces shaanxiensis TaxID=653357 RepID=A0ABP6UNM2_9ACTN